VDWVTLTGMKFGIRVALQTLSTNPTRLQIGLNIYYFRVKNRIENASIDFAINSIRADHVRADQVVEWAKKNILEVLDKNASLLIDPETIVTIPDLNIHIELSIDEDLFSASDKVQEVINQKVKKALYEAHDGIVSIIPELTNTDEKPESPSEKVNLQQDIRLLFGDYFKSRMGQNPSEELMDLFNEVLNTEEEDE